MDGAVIRTNDTSFGYNTLTESRPRSYKSFQFRFEDVCSNQVMLIQSEVDFHHLILEVPRRIHLRSCCVSELSQKHFTV